MDGFRDRVAVVTGAASGIGKALAAAFAGRGAHVVLADLDADGVRAAADEVQAAAPGAGVLAVPTDVADADSVQHLADTTYGRFGAVHVLCNNAGISSVGTTWDTPLQDWSAVWAVNLMGPVHGIRSFLPRMLEGGHEGHVVNTSSMSGLLPVEYKAPYTASKHALVGLSRTLRVELRQLGALIGVSVVCPGAVHTPIVEKQRTRYADVPGLPEAAKQKLATLSETVRNGMPAEEAAEIVLDAVLGGRFWVLPNSESYLDRVSAQHEELLNHKSS